VSELVKQGLIGRLEVINATVRPQAAQALGVRSVPWLKLGPFELEGLRSPAELKRWAERAGTLDGVADYFNELLGSGQLHKALDAVRRDEALLEALPLLLARAGTELPVRVGIGAILEEFQGSRALARLVPALIELTAHADAHLRGDAAHFLALTRSNEAIPCLKHLLSDNDPHVREIAAESLAEIEKAAAPA
jgi:hypothetical protein